MFLHYLVKLKMLSAHMLPLSCYRNSTIYPTSTVAYKFARWFITALWKILQEKVYKTCITTLELATTPLTNGFHHDDIA